MKVDDIKKYWKSGNRSAEADAALWDSQADDQTYRDVYDGFVALLEKEQMLRPEFNVLDIGCGAGAYSLALANKVHSVLGVDISPKMLANGKAKCDVRAISNVTFRLLDWNSVDLKKEGLEECFDLAFAHNTPAICDVETFEKLNTVSKRYCAICTPLSMREPLMDQVQEIAGINEQHNGGECGFSFMLDLLWQKGYFPKLSYEKQIWPMNQSYEDACAYYIGRTQMGHSLPDETIERIKEFLKSKLENGIISDAIHTTVATVFWEKLLPDAAWRPQETRG